MQSVIPHTRFVAGFILLAAHALAAQPIASSYCVCPPDVRSTARQSKHAPESDIARWSAQLKSNDEEERREAAMELASIQDGAATAALSASLNDASPRVRAAVVNALAMNSGEAIAPLLAGRLTGDKDPFVRKAAAYALAKFQGPERTGALITGLRDKDLEVRGAAAVSLGDHPDSSSIEALSAALKDKSTFVRAQAARALGVNGRAAVQTVSTLISLLSSDPDNEVKRQAATALGAIGDRAALPALELARRDKDPYLSQAALDAIKRLQ